MDTISSMNPYTMLTQIDAAIQAILLGGQSYKIGSRSLTRADLGALQNLRKQLKAELDAVCGDPNLIANTAVAFFDKR